MIEADFSLFIIVLSTIPKKPTVNSIAGKIAKNKNSKKFHESSEWFRFNKSFDGSKCAN